MESNQLKLKQQALLEEGKFKKHYSQIQIFPQAQLSEAISDLIKHWRWNRVIVVYVEIDSMFFK